MKGIYKNVLELLKEPKPFKVTAPGIWLSIKKAEKLQSKGCNVVYKYGKITITNGEETQ